MMQTNKVLRSTLLLLVLCGGTALAQTGQRSENTEEGATVQTITHGRAIGITLGTTGIGIQGTYPLSNAFSLRAGISFVPTFNYTRTDKVGTVDLEQHFKTGLTNLHVLTDYYLPTLRKAGFRLTGGFAWFIQAKSDVVSAPEGDYYYGDIQVNDDRMGDIRTTVKRNGIAPYLGAGFLDLYSNKHIHVSMDLGTYYLLPEADVKMTATGYLTGNERNQEQLKENLKGYRWIPVLQFGIYYKF